MARYKNGDIKCKIMTNAALLITAEILLKYKPSIK